MNNHDTNILNHLKQVKQYSNLQREGIINKDPFNTRQYEYLCLGIFEAFMKSFYQEKFQVRLLDFNTPNGCAFKVGATYYSAIHWGSIKEIYKMALLLTEEELFFEDIYSISGYRKLTDSDVTEKDKLIETYYRPLYICGTNDPVRRDLAYLISSIAWLTTIYHEAGHILHGHVDFSLLKNNENSIFILEDECDETTEKRIVRKTIEKDADEFSGNRIVEHIFNTHYNLYFENYGRTIKNKKNLLKILFAAVTLKFLIYGIREVSPDARYLPSAYRITKILLASYSMMNHSNYMQINKDDYEKLLADTVRETIQAFNKKASGNKINEALFVKQLVIGEIDDKELKKKWNEIRPILEKYKHKRIILPPLFDLEKL